MNCVRIEATMNDSAKLKHVNDALKKKFKDKKLVFGKGFVGAKIVFVTETAIPDGHVTGKHLHPHHEKLLNQLFKTAGIDKKKVYFTHAVKYFPSQTIAITPKEIKSHSTFLKEELKSVGPKIVVTLGNLALNGVGMRQPLDNVHGKIFNLGSYELLPTFHPEHALKDSRVKTLLETDFARLKELIMIHKTDATQKP